jgi:DDE family transposase
VSVPTPLYHEVREQIMTHLDPVAVPAASAERLALLVVGILAARSTVLARIARELNALALTAATTPASIGRRLRRTLSDPHLDPARCYHPVVARVLDWSGLLRGSAQVVLIVDESSKADQVPLFRISLAYWGGSLPLAWAVWEQNVPLPDGQYWRWVDTVLAQVAALLPVGITVLVLADRAYAGPGFLDRLDAYGWWWIVRVTTTGSHRVRDEHGAETGLKELVARTLNRPGRRLRRRAELFKDAGWRPVNIVGLWGRGSKEPLVVLTNREPRWAVVREYERRFWIEAGFRADKAKGWQWEASQVQGVTHQARLLLGMAWATLVALCLGVAEAQVQVARLAATPVRLRRRQERPGQPRHARESIFTLGLACIRGWLYQTMTRPWRGWLPALDAPSWHDQWHQGQAQRFIFAHPVRP